jgi:hypothetical protein
MKFLLAALFLLQAAVMRPGSPPYASHSQPSGAHGVRNEGYGLFLRPRDASNKDGEPIVLYSYQPWKCMAWHFEDADGETRLLNFFTGKSFEVQASDAGKPLVQMPASADRQQSEAFKFVALEHGLYEIVSHAGGALTAVDSDGHGDIRVVVAPWKDQASQRWQLVDIPNHFTM